MKGLFFLSLTLLLFSGCKKSNSSASCTLSTTTLVGTYKIAGYTSQQSSTSPVVNDYATTWKACEKDDIIVLNANGTYLRTDAGITCTPPNGAINGTWSLSGNTFTNDGTATTVLSFDCTTFVSATNSYPKETITLVIQ